MVEVKLQIPHSAHAVCVCVRAIADALIRALSLRHQQGRFFICLLLDTRTKAPRHVLTFCHNPDLVSFLFFLSSAKFVRPTSI